MDTAPSVRDIFYSESDSSDGADDPPTNRDALQSIVEIVQKQEELIDLGLRLNSHISPAETDAVLATLDTVLGARGQSGGAPDPSVSVNVPIIGIATYVGEDIHHCDPVNGGCQHQILKTGEFSMLNGHVVFLSKYRGAIVAAELPFGP